MYTESDKEVICQRLLRLRRALDGDDEAQKDVSRVIHHVRRWSDPVEVLKRPRTRSAAALGLLDEVEDGKLKSKPAVWLASVLAERTITEPLQLRGALDAAAKEIRWEIRSPADLGYSEATVTGYRWGLEQALRILNDAFKDAIGDLG